MAMCVQSNVLVFSLNIFFQATTLGIDEELDIVWSAWNAWRQKDIEALDCILAAACEILLKNPFSPSRYHYISCAYISKKMPEAFSFPKTYKMLLKLLSSTTSPPLTNRPNLSAIFASKLLLRGFVGESEWHFEFIEVYLRDVVGPCAWTDHESCAEFVANLLTAFQDLTVIPGNRYSSDEMRKMVRSEYFKVLSQVLGADSTKENPQSLLKLLLIGVEYEDARLIASGMLEDWINNPVHMHSAKALLDCVVKKTHSMSKSDISTVGNLFLLQIKNQHSNIYSNMVCQLVCQRRDYATVALKTLVLLELHATNILNLKRMSTVLRAISGSPPPEWELALILQELAVSDDTRMKLRDFVCRMVRHIGSDINIKDLCHGLLQPWAAMADQNESLKVAWLTEIVELVTTLLLYSTGAFAMDESIMVIVSPPETATFPTSTVANIMASATKEKLEALEKFSLDLAVFQLEVMAWCTDVVAVYVPNMNKVQFTNILGQFLFLGDAESYFPKGEYFGEFACNSLQLISSCTRASEETLARLILLGISEKYPLTMGDALSIIESLVWRAGAFHRHFRGSLLAESKQLPAAVFKLASFSLPGIAEQSLSDIVV